MPTLLDLLLHDLEGLQFQKRNYYDFSGKAVTCKCDHEGRSGGTGCYSCQDKNTG